MFTAKNNTMGGNASPSELTINADGSIYQLDLKPGELATTIITVGDRVKTVSDHFKGSNPRDLSRS